MKLNVFLNLDFQGREWVVSLLGFSWSTVGVEYFGVILKYGSANLNGGFHRSQHPIEVVVVMNIVILYALSVLHHYLLHTLKI